MQKIQRLARKFAHPERIVTNRVEAVRTVLLPSTTLFICQIPPFEDIFLLTEPKGIVHAKMDCILDTPTLLPETRWDVKKVEVSVKSHLLLQMYKDFGATKCTVTRNNHSLSQPFTPEKKLIHTANLLPIALIFGTWKNLG